MKRIEIDLNNIDRAITDIDELIEQIEALPQRLAEDVVPMAHSGYHGEVAVNAEGGNVIATSDKVGFLEYGTGVYAEYDPEAPIPTGYATWSDSPDGAGVLVNKGYWYYNKVKYYGTPPMYAMRNTVEHLKQNGTNLARKHIK